MKINQSLIKRQGLKEMFLKDHNIFNYMPSVKDSFKPKDADRSKLNRYSTQIGTTRLSRCGADTAVQLVGPLGIHMFPVRVPGTETTSASDPASCQCTPQEPAGSSSGAQVPATYTGDLGGVPSFWLQPSPAHPQC